MKTILFVCTGNVCRSPMAEGLFRHAVKGTGEFRVLSAGVGAIDGQPPSAHAVRALRELQIDIVHTEPDFIWLKNGVVLLPRNDFDHQKSFVDEINRIGNEPAEKKK